jgi:hypothetical protein
LRSVRRPCQRDGQIYCQGPQAGSGVFRDSLPYSRWWLTATQNRRSVN